MTAEQIEDARNERRLALRNEFNRIEVIANELFHQGNHIRHEGHQDAWHLCASALDNAGDTASEQGFDCDSLEYWECAIGSLQCLICDERKPRVVRFFKRHNFKF